MQQSTRPRILIVDDESSIRGLLSAILSEKYDCTMADSAESALTFLAEKTFDLVISDINMGGMSGIELVSRAVASSPDTVAMVISGNDKIDGPIDAIRNGAFDYIKKPFDIDQVEMAVDRAIDHAALLASKRNHESQLEELVEARTTKLNYLAYHDSLTGLRNRVFFEESLVHTLESPSGNDGGAVFFVSLNRFKGLRDALGHSLGDGLIKEVARRIQNLIAPQWVVARFEGDEFAIFLNMTDPAELVGFAESIFHAFSAPINLGSHEIFVLASIGISVFPADASDSLTLLKNAGAALAHARKQGGNSYQFYTSNIHENAVKRLAMENDLRRALDREEFFLHYQPKIDIGTKRVTGMEALVRWNHPKLGLVPPLDFIPLAEETGLIVPLGEWVLRTACEQSKIWHSRGFELSVAVNLSPRQFRQRDLVERICQIINETGFDPHFLNLEITESSLMDSSESAIEKLGELKESGIQISIDDFGTGYSSLGVLKDLPIDVLKIDKMFVDDLTTSSDAAALVSAVITLAHQLRLKVVAEGVETDEQLTFLEGLECDEWQGYLFSKPVSTDAFETLLTKQLP